MRAAVVAARNKGGLCGGKFAQRHQDVLAPGARRVGAGANQHKVVVHHRETAHAKAVGHELFLRGLVVDKQHIGIAAPPHVQRLPSAQRHHLDLNAGGLAERWHQMSEQTRLLGGGGGRHHQRAGLGQHRTGGQGGHRHQRRHSQDVAHAAAQT